MAANVDNNLILGIDPGKKGGISLLCGTTGDLLFATEFKLYKNGYINIDNAVTSVTQIINSLDRYISVGAIEKVHSMPGQGVVSTFTFGTCYGLQMSLFSFFGLKTRVFIPPQTWKKYFNLIKKSKKDGYKIIDILYPQNKDLFITKKGRLMDGVVDATLIARYIYETKFYET